MSTSPFTAGQRKVSPDEAYRLAHQHHEAGRHAEALSLLERITTAQPHHAFAWQLMSVIHHTQGNTVSAIDLMSKAIKAHPLVSEFFANRGEMHRLLGDIEQAIADGQHAVRLNPQNALAQSNLGIAYYHQGDLDQAQRCQEQAIALDPKLLPALNNLGSIARDRHHLDAAVDYYRRALALNPAFIESANNLGAVLVEMEKPEEALACLLAVIKHHPGYGEAHSNIGSAFLSLENFEKAELAYQNAIRLQPKHAEAYEGLARCYQEARDLVRAENVAQEALAISERASTWALLGNIYTEQGYPEKAEAAFETALRLKPSQVSAWLGKGHLLMELGRLEAAESCFEQAKTLDPTGISARLAITQVRKTKSDDPNFIALQESAQNMSNLSPSRALSLHFALGKAYEDIKDYDKAFEHFKEACQLKRARIEYSAENNRLIAENICKAFSPERLEHLRGAGSEDATPIFVLGMPRSGTTLTETIIASHPDVHGAGELPDLLQILGRQANVPDSGYPLNVAGLSRDDIHRMGTQYIQQLKQRSPNSARITDKMPANFLGLGMIHLMLPNAKIIHVKRNPVDTCISGYMRLFKNGQHQSYDLREAGLFYRDYLTVMAHWRNVLPAGSFYEIQYEDLVANQEEESRALINYCGLEWNDACLNPHKTERTVKTASITQVRQPVYKTSVERWRVYEKHLGPLLDALGDAITV